MTPPCALQQHPARLSSLLRKTNQALCASQALLHLVECHLEVHLCPNEGSIIVGHPLALAEVVGLAAHPRPVLALVACDGGERPAEEQLLEFEVLWLLVLLIEPAVVGADHGVKQAPLRLLAWLQQRVTLLELLVREVLGGVVADLVLVVLAPVAVLPVAHHTNVPHALLQALHDLEAHVILHNAQGVAKEDGGAVGVLCILCRRDDLVGKDLLQRGIEIRLQHVKGVRLARRHEIAMLLQELLEGANCRKAGAKRGGMLCRVLLPVAGIQVVPRLDCTEVVKELAEQLEVVSGERHLVSQGQLATRPHEVAQRIVLLVVVPLGVLEPRLPDEADVRPLHPRLRAPIDVLEPADDALHAAGLVRQQELGDGADAGDGVRAALPLGVREEEAVGDDAVVAEPAAEHAGAGVVALGVGGGGAEGARGVAGRVLALGPGDVQGPVLLEKALDLSQLVLRQRLLTAELLELWAEWLAQGCRCRHGASDSCGHGARRGGW
mmetsp:Transcript_14390/g.41203  ORF Transcript_14390/g.41203 Transcript_14390/m.41203 type:complete len:495 (+) Transcript_14390:48-1532(+)